MVRLMKQVTTRFLLSQDALSNLTPCFLFQHPFSELRTSLSSFTQRETRNVVKRTAQADLQRCSVKPETRIPGVSPYDDNL